MSTPGGGGASRGIKAKPTPPLKGSFPLDHFGECKKLMVAYNKCMKARSPPQPSALPPRRRSCWCWRWCWRWRSGSGPGSGWRPSCSCYCCPRPSGRAGLTLPAAGLAQEAEGNSSQCRELSKQYLGCRMDKSAPPSSPLPPPDRYAQPLRARRNG